MCVCDCPEANAGVHLSGEAREPPRKMDSSTGLRMEGLAHMCKHTFTHMHAHIHMF